MKIALPGLKQRLSTFRNGAVALSTMTTAKAIPDSRLGAFVIAATFSFCPMFGTHAVPLGITITLRIATPFATAMNMTIPIAMFGGFLWASFLRAVTKKVIHHDEYLEDTFVVPLFADG